MDRASLKNPVYETKINRAVFINQNIIVYAIKGASFALREARTLNADWTFKEMKNV